ncbi:uncharacterized protein LOC125941365 [Dermacentor silvarum]|uniref:uncharacterized protein LOC125941365 n=1 Tax=Dermacentor silvarum TaxID=543639 RepID=UPI0021009C6E|nr:uncharacterized protein LOC125941365 [Dermacentor silvarum]
MAAPKVSTRRTVLRIAVALAIATYQAVVCADGVKPHQPKIIEKIMGPIVREVELSQLGGPAKRSFRDDRSEVMNKLKMEPIIEPLVVEGFGLPAVAEKGAGGTEKVKEQDGGHNSAGGHETNAESKKVNSVPSSSSGLAEPPSPPSRFGGDPRHVDLMQYFWNKFMATPPEPLPQKPVVGRNEDGVVRTGLQKKEGSNATVSKPEQEVLRIFVKTVSKTNATEAARGGLLSRLSPGMKPFPDLPRNRSAYSVVEAFPAQSPAAVESVLIERIERLELNFSRAFTVMILVMLLMPVACSISCSLDRTRSSALKNRGRSAHTPSVWATKSGKLLRLRGASEDVSKQLPVTRITGPWRA